VKKGCGVGTFHLWGAGQQADPVRSNDLEDRISRRGRKDGGRKSVFGCMGRLSPLCASDTRDTPVLWPSGRSGHTHTLTLGNNIGPRRSCHGRGFCVAPAQTLSVFRISKADRLRENKRTGYWHDTHLLPSQRTAVRNCARQMLQRRTYNECGTIEVADSRIPRRADCLAGDASQGCRCAWSLVKGDQRRPEIETNCRGKSICQGGDISTLDRRYQQATGCCLPSRHLTSSRLGLERC